MVRPSVGWVVLIVAITSFHRAAALYADILVVVVAFAIQTLHVCLICLHCSFSFEMYNYLLNVKYLCLKRNNDKQIKKII